MTRKFIAVLLAGAGALLVAAALSFGATNPTTIVPASAPETDYHAEGAIVAGNIEIQTVRAPNKGPVVASCDPDPRLAPHARPDDCAWAEPAGSGRDRVNFDRHILDAGDFSPDGAIPPKPASATRENFNGKAGFDTAGPQFVGDFFDDDDMHYRLTPRTLDAYLAPNGDPNNRWRRWCGTGTIEAFNGAAPLAPFAVGQIRKFVVEVWDGEFRDTPGLGGGQQDFWVIDILKPGSTFDVSRCQSPAPNLPPPNRRPGNPPPAPPSPVAGSLPSLVVQGSRQSVLGADAHLAVPRACASRKLSATIIGKGIARVEFSLDGKRVATVGRPDAHGRFRLRGDVSGLRAGAHRLSARVVFDSATATPPRTLTLGVVRCASARRRAFTG
jgi:hypothetical protein